MSSNLFTSTSWSIIKIYGKTISLQFVWKRHSGIQFPCLFPGLRAHCPAVSLLHLGHFLPDLCTRMAEKLEATAFRIGHGNVKNSRRQTPRVGTHQVYIAFHSASKPLTVSDKRKAFGHWTTLQFTYREFIDKESFVVDMAKYRSW